MQIFFFTELFSSTVNCNKYLYSNMSGCFIRRYLNLLLFIMIPKEQTKLGSTWLVLLLQCVPKYYIDILCTILLCSAAAVVPKRIHWIRQPLACSVNERTSVWVAKSGRVKLITYQRSTTFSRERREDEHFTTEHVTKSKHELRQPKINRNLQTKRRFA